MKRRVLLLMLLLLASGCQKQEQDAQPTYTVEQHAAVVFRPDSPQLEGIKSLPVEPRKQMALRFNGRLVWNEDRTVRVFAPFAGRVSAIAVRPGEHVKAGQTLAVLAAPELGMAQAEARKAEQDHALAQKNFDRVEELYKAGVAPAKDYQQAQADVARSAAERSRTLAKLKLYGKTDTVDQTLQLKSPIAGVVVERNLNPGQEIRPDQGDKALFVVSDPARLWFLLDVAEKDIGSVKAGTEVALSATSLGEDQVKGRIQHVADLVDPQTRSVKVRGSVEGSDARLKAEMFVVAELRVDAPGGFLVPSAAIYLKGEQYFVFVDEGNGRFVRKTVQPGPITNSHQVVLAGLNPSDKVVAEGALLLEHLLASKD